MKDVYKNVSDEGSINLDFFMSDDTSLNLPTYPEAEEATPKKKRGRPKKKTTPEGVEYVASEPVPDTPLSMAQSNEPYLNTYEDTNNMLKGTIYDIDELCGSVRKDIESIRNSKTLRNKFTNLSNLVSTESTLLSTKINAIKELNKSKTDSHNLELKRLSGSMAIAAGKQDDNKIISDMYNALVQTPMGTPGTNPFGLPSSQDLTVGGMGALSYNPLVGGDMGYSEFINNPTAEQATVMASNNPNIKTVVVYDEYAPVGQNVRFDVIDTQTGQSVPNVPRPDSMFLGDLKIEPEMGVAVNNNLNMTYDLINVRNPQANVNSLSEY